MSVALAPAAETGLFTLGGPFALEGGAVLPEVEVAFRTWGQLDAERANAVVVCHALTGSADAEVWWPGLFGPGRAFDPERDFVLCSNVLGGCYGTTGPTSTAPDGRPFGRSFPAVTVRDMVRLQMRLADHLGIRRIRLVTGGSLGGMQALEWALLEPERVEAAAVISASGRHSAWCIALSEAQRRAIEVDPVEGLAVARMIAMVSYRSRASFEARFGRRRRGDGGFEAESYLRYQGDKLVRRFDAETYLTLTRAMDSHDVARDRGPYQEVLASIRQPILVVASDSDLLYPREEQEELVRQIPGARLERLASPHGHDAFLIEQETVAALLRSFRREVASCRSSGGAP